MPLVVFALLPVNTTLPCGTPFRYAVTVPKLPGPTLVMLVVAYDAERTTDTAVPPATLKLPHPLLSVCAKLHINAAVVALDIAIV